MTIKPPSFDASALLEAIDSAGTGYAICQLNGQLLFCSPTFCDQTGILSADTYDDRHWYSYDHAPPETQRTRHGLWQKFIASKEDWKDIYRWYTPDGEIRFFEGTARFYTDEYVILIINDHTDKINAHQQLADTEQFNAEILDNIPLNIFVIDQSYNIQYINNYLPLRLGKTPEEFLGKSLKSVIGASLEDAAKAEVDQIYRTKKNAQALFMQPRDGALGGTHWLVQSLPLKSRNGEVTGVLTLATDRTDSVRLRNERIKFADAIHNNQKITALNEFAGSLAHELSNLLHPIAGYARLISNDPLSETQKKYADKINTAAMSAGRILRRTLNMSHTDHTEASICDVWQTLQDTLDMADDMAPEGLSYSSNLDTIKGATGQCVGSELRQVLLNILNNSAEAMHYRGNIDIELKTNLPRPTDVNLIPTGSAPFLCISITDEGPGIADDIRARIFEPFFTTKPVGHGTGLGLPVVQGLVTSWGGIISLDARKSSGARFHIWVPERLMV